MKINTLTILCLATLTSGLCANAEARVANTPTNVCALNTSQYANTPNTKKSHADNAPQLPITISATAGAHRDTYSLNGRWQCAVTDDKQTDIPDVFPHTIPVPSFWNDGDFTESYEGRSLWYKTTLHVKGNVPERVILRIAKAEFGQTIYVNGKRVRYFPYNFVASETELSDYLNADAENEIVVRVSNKEDQTTHPEGCGHQGFDGERFKYFPGIYDDVTLIVSGQPAVDRLQTAVDLKNGTLKAFAVVTNGSQADVNTDIRFNIDRIGVVRNGQKSKRSKAATEVIVKNVSIAAGETKRIEQTLTIEGFDEAADAWTPENPVLYELTVSTSADSRTDRFAMRTFGVDPLSKRMLLNGKPRYLLGTNLLFYRFADDSLRRSLPWNDEWIDKFFNSLKSVGFDSYRMCSGFGAERWYDKCDELGLMIQDEYPYWQVCTYNDRGKFCNCTLESLLPEYRLWMRERGMHPSVVIWDLQNESFNGLFTDMAELLREEDPQHRPFEMGWTHNTTPTDIKETHPYVFCAYDFNMGYMNSHDRVPNTFGNSSFDLPMIINEYGYNWLNRNGDPTSLGKNSYDWNVPNGSSADRLEYYASSVSQLTEFWRISGTSAGIHHFCALTYSYANSTSGFTGDILMPEVDNPRIHPCIAEAFKSAFNPLMVGIDDYIEDVHPSSDRTVDIWLINDRQSDAGNIDVRVDLTQGVKSRKIWSGRLNFDPASNDRQMRRITIPVKAKAEEGALTLTASFKDPLTGNIVKSVRHWDLLDHKAGAALNCPSRASSSLGEAFWETPCNAIRAFDGSQRTRWHSRPVSVNAAPKSHQQLLSEQWSEAQGMADGEDQTPWIEVDLGNPHIISRISLDWATIAERVYVPDTFAIQISDDGQNYKTIWTGEAPRQGGRQTIDIPPTRARLVRMQTTGAMPEKSVSLWEFDVY